MSEYVCNKSFDSSDTISNTALCGNLKAFKYLFNTPENIEHNESQPKDYYLAHNASASGNLNLLIWTLKNTKCKITDQDEEGLTVLHVAALASNFNIVEWVVKHTHLSTVIRTEEGATALHFACWSGNLEIVKLLIEIEPRLINMRMTNGATAAMYAAQGGFLDIMEFLLNEGANFGLPTKNGVNCLHMAAQQGHIECVKWLIEHTGLRLNGKDENGITPIHYAAIYNRHDVVSWLLEKEVRLLKERFIVDCQHSVSISEPSKTIEDLINAKSNLSVKHICEFAALESVQEKLTMILADYNPSTVVQKEEDEISGLVQCCIPISVLLLLQSALTDLRSQYQKMVRQSYLTEKPAEPEHMSEETQTNETFNNFDEASPSGFLIPRPIMDSQEEESPKVCDDPVPPPPPIAPPEIIPPVIDSSISSTTGYENKKAISKFNIRRRGSSTDDIKKSLIQELKNINTFRMRNNKAVYSQEDNESNTDSSSINEYSLTGKSAVRKSITDSAPNLLSIFNCSAISPSNNVVPNWKTKMVTKNACNVYKDEDSSKLSNEIPVWKRQILEKRELSLNKTKKDNPIPNPLKISLDGSISLGSSKVTQLVNQWQNKTT